MRILSPAREFINTLDNTKEERRRRKRHEERIKGLMPWGWGRGPSGELVASPSLPPTSLGCRAAGGCCTGPGPASPEELTGPLGRTLPRQLYSEGCQ